jgi:ElaA protein
VTLRAARFDDLDAATLYALLRLRVDVFVVEQHCPYPELDGRDREPGTVHLWLEHDGAPSGRAGCRPRRTPGR